MAVEEKKDALEADLAWLGIADPEGVVEDSECVSRMASKADAEHTHEEHGDINFTGTVSADGEEGLTGQRTVQGYTLTFKKGLLVGFEAP